MPRGGAGRKTPRSSGAVSAGGPRVVLREADAVVRRVYTRTQAAQALGISPTTFARRVLPHIETVEMRWGARARQAPPRLAQAGCRPGIPADILHRIHTEHAAGAPKTPFLVRHLS